jgi:hypothetical protein
MNMKKQLITASLLFAFASFSAYSQGNVNFSAGSGTAKNAVTGGNSAGTVAFFFAPVGTVSALGNGMATSGLTEASHTWSDVLALMGSGWTLGKTGGAEVDGIISGSAFGGGSFAYDSGTSFAVDNWAAGTSQSVVVIAWYGAYANLADAAANNADLGWSSAFTYMSGANASDPNGTVNFSNQTQPITSFGIAPAPVVVPEPGTLALAGLGGFGMLMAFRRKKA